MIYKGYIVRRKSPQRLDLMLRKISRILNFLSVQNGAYTLIQCALNLKKVLAFPLLRGQEARNAVICLL